MSVTVLKFISFMMDDEAVSLVRGYHSGEVGWSHQWTKKDGRHRNKISSEPTHLEQETIVKDVFAFSLNSFAVLRRFVVAGVLIEITLIFPPGQAGSGESNNLTLFVKGKGSKAAHYKLSARLRNSDTGDTVFLEGGDLIANEEIHLDVFELEFLTSSLSAYEPKSDLVDMILGTIPLGNGSRKLKGKSLATKIRFLKQLSFLRILEMAPVLRILKKMFRPALAVLLIAILAARASSWWDDQERNRLTQAATNEVVRYLVKLTGNSFVGCRRASIDDVRENQELKLNDVILMYKPGIHKTFLLAGFIRSNRAAYNSELESLLERLRLSIWDIPIDSCEMWDLAINDYSARLDVQSE